jgi:hypothetical protein
MSDTIARIIVGAFFALVIGLWYYEKRKREEAEIQVELSKRREALNALQPKLDENKIAYDAALAGGIPVIHPDMLADLRVSDPHVDTRPVQAGPVEVPSLTDSGPGTVEPQPDSGGSGEVKTVH